MKKNIDWFRAMIQRIMCNKLTVFVMGAIFVVLASFYHYSLLCEFPPNGEEIQTILSMFSHLNLGTGWIHREFLFDFLAFLATEIGGISYFATRLFFTFFYVILIGGTTFLCVKSKEGQESRLYFLPLIGLMAVALFPLADNPDVFSYTGSKGMLYLWSFNYHYPARIYSIICLILIGFSIQCSERKKRVVYSVILIMVCIYAMKTTDLVFYIMFMAPAIIVFMLHILQGDKSKKYGIYMILGGMGVLFLCRFLPVDFVRAWWTKESADVYGAIYGATNWSTVKSIGERLLSYVELICLSFNIQLPGAPVISFYTVVYVLKIVILTLGYFIMFHIIKCSFQAKCKECHYDFIDEILAWSYLLMSCVFIFTEFGHVGYARYFPGLTTVMTILLCRNLEGFPRIIEVKWLQELRNKKVLFFVCTFVLCACAMGKVWTYHAPNEYDDELKAIIAYVEESDLGYAVANYWMFPRATALSEGRVMVYQTEEKVKEVYGNDAKVTYIITHNDNSSDNNGFLYYDYCETYEEMCEYYSTPTDIIRYDKLMLVIYKDGIEIKE